MFDAYHRTIVDDDNTCGVSLFPQTELEVKPLNPFSCKMASTARKDVPFAVKVASFSDTHRHPQKS